jgi:hypothetical protein
MGLAALQYGCVETEQCSVSTVGMPLAFGYFFVCAAQFGCVETEQCSVCTVGMQWAFGYFFVSAAQFGCVETEQCSVCTMACNGHLDFFFLSVLYLIRPSALVAFQRCNFSRAKMCSFQSQFFHASIGHAFNASCRCCPGYYPPKTKLIRNGNCFPFFSF